METTKGVVILYEDLCGDWIRLARDGRLTSIGVHKLAYQSGAQSVDELLSALDAPGGRRHVDALTDAGVRVEYELHAMAWLLPRDRFAAEPELFRQNEAGERVPDWNLCPSNPAALETVAENACRLAKRLRQASHRYYLWTDDAPRAICRCPKCTAAGLNGSDQQILITNAIAEGLRAYDSEAKAAYLAYADAKSVPTLPPAANVFLEFAPMDRNHEKPITSPDEPAGAGYCRLLSALLRVFPAAESEVLEYWLDDVMFSKSRKPAIRVPFYADVAEADTAYYTAQGIRRIKCFASFLDAEYVQMYGDPPIRQYGDILAKYLG